MKKLVLVPNNMGSRSAKALAEVLSTRVAHKVFRVPQERVGRRIAFVLKSGTDKLTQFRRFHDSGVSAPEFTTERGVAGEWLRDGSPVVARTLLRGSEGRGIVVAESLDQLVEAPLYTKYVKKKKEFRVHVLNGQVIDVQEKRRKAEHDGERNTRIRNLANGYVFCRGDIVEPAGLSQLATNAVASLGYTMGAVDIVYNDHHGTCYVLEVNSTPGMEGTTLEKYADAITGWYKEQRAL
jgi:glutathione synthase/RimK-type ligase-like ATP-grasp enzyme